MKILGYEIKRAGGSNKVTADELIKDDGKNVKIPPSGRSSEPDYARDFNIDSFGRGLNVVKHDYCIQAIPLIRKLYKKNSDVGSVVNDLMQLTNTGHKIKFDSSIKPDVADKMKKHLEEVTKHWGQGTFGIDGIVNKLIIQIWVSGALSAERVVNSNLDGIDFISIVNPENIYFSINRKGRYKALQKTNKYLASRRGYKRLNMNTYKYLGIYSDEDTPYGVPPFLTALEELATQKDMKDNIKHILKQMGLLGYLQVKMDKPRKMDRENDSKYKNRLTQLLDETKKNLLKGFKDGIVVGYDEDHEFEFQSTTKNLTGVSELFNMNENQVANGLKTAGAFLGLEQKGGEGQLGIVFTKMLSQLKNVQRLIAFFMEDTYALELRLAGFDPKGIKVDFFPSTITDDLKFQQGKEIKQRILRALWTDGIIGPDQYADEMGYIKPFDYKEPPAYQTEGDQVVDEEKRKKRESDKDRSDRRSRDKSNPNPKRRDRDTKER